MKITHPNMYVMQCDLLGNDTNLICYGVRQHESAKVKPPDHQSDYSLSVKLQRVGNWHQERNYVSEASNQ